MKTYCTIKATDGRSFDLINMNSQKPVLFQVFTTHDNKLLRFHLVSMGENVLQFAMRTEVPKEILFYEAELSHLIIQDWYPTVVDEGQ